MQKEQTIKWLARYLIGYGLLHLATFLMLFAFERGWLLFAYVWLFWLHVPFMLLGSALVFLAKKVSNAWIWFLALICFVLSNLVWLFDFWTVQINFAHYPFILTTIVPICCTARLFVLERKSEADSI